MSEEEAVPLQDLGSQVSLAGQFAALTPEQTAAHLRTSLSKGLKLSPSALSSLRSQHGSNALPEPPKETIYAKFLSQFIESKLILLLLGSAVISVFLGNWDDAISITLAVVIVVTVGTVQEYRSDKSVEALNKLVAYQAHVIRTDPSTSSPSLPPSNGRRSPPPIQTRDLTPVPAALEDTAQPDGPLPATVAANVLLPGDLVYFSTGDRIPADIRLVTCTDLDIDESSLTGENKPVRKTSDTLPPPSTPFLEGTEATGSAATAHVSDKVNIGFMGTLVRHGHGTGLVIATGSNTALGQISISLASIEKPRTPLQLAMDQLGHDLSMVSAAVIVVIVLVGVLQGRKWLEMFQVGVSLAVAAIPEGLPIVVTVTLALGVMRMVRTGGIMRRLPSVETLGCVSVVCSDKTGTLTENHMTVQKLWTPDHGEPVEKRSLLPQSSDLGAMTGSVLEPAVRTLLRIGNICNNARLSGTAAAPTSVLQANSQTASRLSAMDSSSSARSADIPLESRYTGQPTDVALLDLLDYFHMEDLRDRFGGVGVRIAEMPFSSEKKWMGVVIGAGSPTALTSAHGSEAVYIKGAIEQVLRRCDSYLTKDGREIVLDEPRRKLAFDASEVMARDGLRVLAFATGSPQSISNPRRPYSNVGSRSATPQLPDTNTPKTYADDQYCGLTFAGLVGMSDPPRKGVASSMKTLMKGGVKVVMITGDAETTAVAIARKLGMPLSSGPDAATTKSVLSGSDVERMSEQELSQVVRNATVFARTSPDHKLKIIKAYQMQNQVVAMTGDGVNDAPALKSADIGIAMGRHGTDVAKEAADMILSTDNFSTILHAIEEGKGIFYNIQNFLTFQLSTSVAALSLILLSTIFGLQNPLNPMQILWINILMDGPPAQSLGVEPVDPAVMSRPPRKKDAKILTKGVIRRVLTQAAIIVAGTMLIYVKEMAADHQVTARDTTMTFTCFVLFDMFNALSCRSEGKSVLLGETPLFGNKMFNFAVSGSLLGQLAVIYLPPLQTIFQTEALSLADIFWLIIIASSVFFVDEIRKFVRRHSRRRELYSGYSSSV